MLTIYGIKNCSTMKKAFDWLDQHQMAYQFFDYKKQAIDAKALQSWIDQLGLEVVINKRGMTWRKLTEEQKTQAEHADSAIILLQAQPSMIKRPIIVNSEGQVVLVGFDAVAYQAALIT
ncbi:MAG: ArsC family reductase [Pseudomonadota bacterium]|nr:ArsC family reductase [Pseudomonadota bacterium]